MNPRGKTKQLIEAMQAQPDKVLWTPQECTDVTGVAGLSAQLAGAIRREWIYKHDLGGRRVAYSLQPQEEEAAEEDPQQEFLARLDSDGDLDLYGCIELENGGVRLTAEMLAKLKRLIAFVPA